MCDLLIKEKFVKKLKKNNLFEYFKNVFGENFAVDKINFPGWWFDNNKISYCVGNYPDSIKSFYLNRNIEDHLIRKVIQNLGYKYEYSFKENVILFLKDDF